MVEETDKQVKAAGISLSNYTKTAIVRYDNRHDKKAFDEELAREVLLLKEFDPDNKLEIMFQTASLHDLQK